MVTHGKMTMVAENLWKTFSNAAVDVLKIVIGENDAKSL